MRTYAELDAYLGKKQERPAPASGKRTRIIRRDDGRIAVKYHETDVLTFAPSGVTVLDSGGWLTLTTRECFNTYLPGGFRVHQERGVWYVARYEDPEWKTYGVFKDGCRVTEEQAGGLDQPEVAKAIRSKRAKINQYVQDFTAALLNGEVPAPSTGDCLYCGMVTENGTPLGEASKSPDHIWEHIAEPYYVPSLLARAVKVGNCPLIVAAFIGEIWLGKPVGAFNRSVLTARVPIVLRKYILRQLGHVV